LFGYARPVAYRDELGDAGEAPTSEGVLRAQFGPRHVRLAVASRSLDVADRFATVVEHHRRRAEKDRRQSFRITGRLIVARDVPREGLGIWVDIEPLSVIDPRGRPRAGVRRIFGVEPTSLLEPAGLASLAALDHLAKRIHEELGHLAPDVRRAFEIGSPAASGLDKVLVVDCADRYVVYARRLFRDRARFAMAIHDDGRIVVPDGRGTAMREITVRSRHGVTVVGDYVRFADAQGTDLAKVAIPWLTPEDRLELARRIGQRIDRDREDAAPWPPDLARQP
jgi:hypothetical protein